jgi:regulator of nonsense transcripts 2
LNSDFRRLQRKKTLTDARFLNIRYIAELTKFRITPQHVVFHCLKVLLEDFSHANIELIAQMLEGCGRFLYASPDTTTQMAAMVLPTSLT